MNNWNRLIALLDMTLGFPNKIRSSVKKTLQSFDQRTGEHVFVLEYRIKVRPGIEPPEKPIGRMDTLRQLMRVRT